MAIKLLVLIVKLLTIEFPGMFIYFQVVARAQLSTVNILNKKEII